MDIAELVFQNENRHRLIEYDLYESCLKRQLFYTKWCWEVIASALSRQNERSYPDDRKKKGVEHNLFLGPVQNLRCRHRCIGSSCVRDIGGDDAGQLAGRGIQDG